MRKFIRRCAVALLGAAALAQGGTADASDYCNPSQKSWDPCYDPGKSQPPQERAGTTLPPAECDDLELQVSLPLGQLTCRAVNLADGDARGRAERVSVDGSGSFLAVEYIYAGLRSYIYRTNPAQVAEASGLKTVGGERGAQFRLHDFDIRRFAQSDLLECVAFTRHWGHVPQSPGYRHRISGIYCSARAADLADANLDRVLAGIEPGG